MEKPFVNAWTEFGELEYVCLGTAANSAYAQVDLPYDGYENNIVRDKHLANYVTRPLGARPAQRIAKAQEELEYLREILEGEQITVASVVEAEADIKQDLRRKRSFAKPPRNVQEDKRVPKKKIEVCRPPEARFDHLIMTPWFKNYFQVGLVCPRDSVITFGNTILECATAARCRYFESVYYRDIIYGLWKTDRRVHWKTAPKPTCKDSMYRLCDPIENFGNTTEDEVVFDAADMMRLGKDVFFKKTNSTNYTGLEWLRREFPELRFHPVHFDTDITPHIDVDLTAMAPPTSGSDGIVLVNHHHPPLKHELDIFKQNDWKVYEGPMPANDNVSPVAMCSSDLNMNLLSVSPKCCIIEECEVPMYHFLEDLGFDVITTPLRTLNEFGGGVHCVTWDIRRNDTCKDYFPEQDYEAEVQRDYQKALAVPKGVKGVNGLQRLNGVTCVNGVNGH